MLVYYTYVDVNKEFDADLLIDMYIDWLQNSKNRMEGLVYDHSYDFQYTVEKKTLRIKDFEEKGILGLQFITSYNRMGMTFVVEVMFDYDNHLLEFYFYHEFNDGTRKSMPNISIPNIFNDLLMSPYILDDHGLRITHKPIYTNQFILNQWLKDNHRLPIIVLYRNNQCLLSPNIVSRKLFGIGHVVVVNTDKSPSISIYYPDKTKETINNQHQLLNILFDKIRYYMIDHNGMHYSFDDLRNVIKRKKHESNMNELNDLRDVSDYFIETFKKDIDQLNEDNHLLNQEIEELEKQLKEYNDYLLYFKEDSVLNTSDLLYKEKKEYVFKVLNQTLNELTENKRYRKKDVIESLIRREHEVLKQQDQSKKYNW